MEINPGKEDFFVEIGPGSSCTRMIGAILGDRPHVARSVLPPGGDGVGALLRVVAQLIAARNYQYFTLYTVVGALYFVVGFGAARLVDQLEHRTRTGYRRRRRAA